MLSFSCLFISCVCCVTDLGIERVVRYYCSDRFCFLVLTATVLSVMTASPLPRCLPRVVCFIVVCLCITSFGFVCFLDGMCWFLCV